MYEYAKQEQIKKSSAKKLASLNRTNIPDTLKANFENYSGFSLDDVRVHYNSDKPAQF